MSETFIVVSPASPPTASRLLRSSSARARSFGPGGRARFVRRRGRAGEGGTRARYVRRWLRHDPVPRGGGALAGSASGRSWTRSMSSRTIGPGEAGRRGRPCTQRSSPATVLQRPGPARHGGAPNVHRSLRHRRAVGSWARSIFTRSIGLGEGWGRLGCQRPRGSAGGRPRVRAPHARRRPRRRRAAAGGRASRPVRAAEKAPVGDRPFGSKARERSAWSVQRRRQSTSATRWWWARSNATRSFAGERWGRWPACARCHDVGKPVACGPDRVRSEASGRRELGRRYQCLRVRRRPRGGRPAAGGRVRCLPGASGR